jgi:putative hydroxymethylpyrimidine transporter CytX
MKKSAMFLLWVGAAISISEIYTGGLLGPLGYGKGLAAILTGHIIGTGLLALGGHIAFIRKKNAMECVSFSLGSLGGKLVALCNVIQLAGWTIIMIVQAGSAIISLFDFPFAPVALALGLVVLIWALIFGSPAQWINSLVVILLSILCIVLFWESAGLNQAAPHLFGTALSDSISFALAMELSITMPISWLPLIGDYSSRSDNRICASAMPFAGYFLGSVLMYGFGLFISVRTGGDFFTFIAGSRFRLIACAVVVFSTMTTAFLDLYSAAISSTQLVREKNKRMPILVIGIFALLVSAFFPAEKYSDFLTNFLTTIGMVFVPVYAILFMGFFTKNREYEKPLNWSGLIIAITGMVVYRICTIHEIWIPTLICIIVVSGVYLLFILIQTRKEK